jgi:hypothetical protein
MNTPTLQSKLAGIRSSDRQQAIDQATEPPRLLEHAPDHLPVMFDTFVLLESDLADGSDGRKRCAQFVGSVRRKPLKLFKRIAPAALECH